MRKKIFTFLLALAASVGLSWATDPIVIYTNTGQPSYTQGDITITCSRPGDSDGFYLEYEASNTATITNSGSSTISQIELEIGWFPGNRSYVRANGAEPTSSDQYSITFSNVNSNNVALTITNEKIQIRNVTITLADEGGSDPEPTPTPSATSGIFAYNYDCQRSPAFPTQNVACTLSSFKVPYVGLNGIGPENESAGPWKVEFYEMYDADHVGTYSAAHSGNVAYRAWDALTEYYNDVPSYNAQDFPDYAHEKLPVYRLYQWDGSAYQIVGYGFVCAYAGEGNVVEHAALFVEAGRGFGCFLSGHEHSADLPLTFDYDIKDDITSFFPASSGGSTPEPEPAATVTVVFEANNNQKEVEVTLPHTFACDFENGNGELDGIIQELYALQYGGYCPAFTAPTATGNTAVTASKDGNNHYIAISEAFEGTATVTGNYIKYLDTEHMGNSTVDYTLTISVQGSTPDPEPQDPQQATSGIFNYNYDAWSSPGYPSKGYNSNIYEFTVPYIGLGGIGSSSINESEGPWKLEFLENYNHNNTAYHNDNTTEKLWGVLGNYHISVPDYWQEEDFWEFVDAHPVPIFSLSQWNGSAYEFVCNGYVCAYANENNVEHAAIFYEMTTGQKCYLTDVTHTMSDDIYVIFDSDLADGLQDLVPAPVVPTDQELADAVIALINAIGNVEYTQACKDKIDAARAAYDALNADQKELVENYGVLLDAETAYAQLIPHPNGECGAQGDNLLWELNTSTGELTITGSGAMADWNDDTQLPWYSNRLQITSVELPEGLTVLGTKAFRGCTNLASINMAENYPASLTTIKQEAFCHTALTSVTIPATVETIGQDAFYLSQGITDVYCYADPNNLTWNDYYKDDFNKSPAKSTQCHVKNCHLDVFNTNWNTGNSTDVNVTFVGDLPGECGGSTPAVDQAVQDVIDLIDAIGTVEYTQACKEKIDAARAAYEALNADQKTLVSNYSTLTDAEDAYAALIPVVTNYSISLDGITENADKVTLNKASAAEGETITLTPAAGYQITSFTASYASAYSVRVTADPSVDVYEATPYVGALPKEFTENVTPGLNGATFHSIEGDDPFTPVPASVLEYVGMNAAKDQMTIRVNDVFSGIIRVYYTYNVQTCEWDDYSQQEICMGGTAQASVRVVCEAAGGVAPASKDAVTGAYSFTMPAGNVTITATVEAIPTPANSCGDGLTWELNAGVLTISYDGVGTGVMDDWGGYNEAPWSSEKLQITSVMLPEGITTIGSAAFRGCTNLASVNMAENFPASLTTIKTEAFYNSALTSVTIPANVVSIYSNVFYGCQSIANVYCYANPNNLVWMDGYCDDFNSGNKITQCHVKNCYLSLYNTKWNTGYELTDVNVTFVGDLPGDCGSSTFIDADFAINFMNDPYIVVGGGDLPEGVLVEGIPNKDINHGYYNVIITIPAKAGTYKVTLGTCGWGNGNGTIQNENGSTTYASFNQHLADNDLCYHQDPTNNIVTAIFTLPEDQNIIVDCGEYTPYFSIEPSSAPVGPTYLDADFAIDFRTDPYTKVGGGDLPAGVLVEGSMNKSDAAHGYRLPVITIPVTAGNYKVMMGTCSYSNQDATIKTEDGSYTYATLATNNGTCYHQNTATNVVGAIFNVPSDQIIKVYGAEYTPFFSIKKMEAVPAFTDFEINFRTETYSVISGAKPEGTVIIGTYHDNLHGYQNVEAVVPVEAGNYRLTVGACQYGTPGNVMSETNAELASFNSNLGEGNCYHNNTAANIVSTIFTVDIDQTITINGGAYMPYMKLEKLLDNTYYINFENAEGAIGTVPGEIAVTAGESWTIPANLTLYKEGYTFAGWSDGVNTYAPGDEFFPNAHGTLQAVYTPNSVSIADASAINVKWYFGESNGAPSVTWNGAAGYLLAKGEVDGQMIDLKLDIDATSGKFDNAGRGDKWAQVNANTVFTFPSKEGAVVDVETYSGNATYDLGNGTLTCNANDYYSYLEIVYPAPAQTEEVNTNPDPENPSYHYSTFYHSSQNYALTNDGTTAFVADLSGSDLVLTKIAEGTQVIPANTAVILRKSGSNEPVVLNPTEENGVSFEANNDLQGVDEATTLESLSINPLNCYVLSGRAHDESVSGVGFYRIYGNTLKAHKAYVIYNGNQGNAPRRMRFVFDTATGVENAEANVKSIKLIENGQLVIIKNGVRYNAQGQIVK